MDINATIAALAACMSPNTAERQAAEAMLKQHEYVPGHAINLLRIAAEPQVAEATRQAAAINFKNIVKRGWEAGTKPDAPVLSPGDKDAIRSGLLEALIRAPHVVSTQLAETFKAVAYCDYPEAWPQLLPELHTNLTSTEEARVGGALTALRVLTRKYEFRDSEERGPLGPLLATALPALLTIFQGLLAAPSASPVIATYQKLVLKTFWSATYMEIPAPLLAPDAAMAWMAAVHAAVIKPVPTEGQPADPEERPSWPWWKAKKWALHCAYRLFSRYSDPKRCRDNENDKAFAQMFVSHGVMQQFLSAHLSLLEGHVNGAYSSPRVLSMALQFLTHAVDVKAAYALLADHMEPLLLRVAFPLMCFGDEDAALWREDPQEYVRKGYDLLEDMYSPKTAATNFVHTVCSSKGKTFMPRFMGHVVGVLNAYTAAAAAAPGGAVPQELARQMDGALLAVGSMCALIKRKKAYKGQVEQLLLGYVQPCFASPYGHLRAKACWVAGMYCDTEFAGEGKGKGPKYGSLLQAVMRCLGDSELPVQVDAVVGLRMFVDELEELEALKPLLPQLMDAIFRLMHQVETEDLVATLETIVDKFGEDIGPYAVQLCTNLTEAFWKYKTSGEEAEDEDFADIAEVAAYGCLRAITTLLDSVANQKALLPALEASLLPLMTHFLSSSGQDVFEDVLEILAFFTYYPETISPQLWGLWPRLQACLCDWAVDYWEYLLAPLDNFISRGTEHFLTCKQPDYLASVYAMVQHSLAGDYDEADIKHAVTLLEIVLQNCRGRVDEWVEPYIGLCLAKLKVAETRSLSDALLVVIANCLYYNAPLTLAALQRAGALQGVFSSWFAAIFKRKKNGKAPHHFRRAIDKKTCILGLCSLLMCPELPAEISSSLAPLMSGMMRLLLDLKAQEEEAERRAEESEEEEEEEGEDDGSELEDDDDEDDEDAMLAKLKAAARDVLGGGGDDDDDDDWSDEDDDVMTPLDPIDPFVFFADTLSSLQAGQPGRYQGLVAGCDAGAQAAVQGLMGYAQAQREKAAKEAAEKKQ